MTTDADETVTVTVSRELASEMESILRDEVRYADEYHATERTMERFADELQGALGNRE